MSGTELGYLLWTRVTSAELSFDEVESLEGLVLPDRPIPIDVFRRVTGPTCVTRVPIEGVGELELSTAKVESPSEKMIVRHLVASLKKGGVVQVTRKVGDAVFYKPPRGKNTKARMRVAVSASGTPTEWSQPLNAFAAELRSKYAAGVAGTLDTQAIRRIIRSYLTGVGALYLEGPYFVLDRELVQPLRPLFDLLGDAGMLHDVPLPDTPEDRALLARGLEAAVTQDVDVNPAIWARLEEEPHGGR